MDQKIFIRIWHRFEKLYQLRMKSHAEFEFNSDLMKESQSRDVTIENLIQRNKDLVVQNDKLNVKKGFKILSKSSPIGCGRFSIETHPSALKQRK